MHLCWLDTCSRATLSKQVGGTLVRQVRGTLGQVSHRVITNGSHSVSNKGCLEEHQHGWGKNL